MSEAGARSVGASRVRIIAFDGIIADSLPSRAAALADATVVECAALGVYLHPDDLLKAVALLLPGRTFNEAVQVAVEQLPALQDERLRHDVTAHDLIALRAQRSWAQTVRHGVPLCDGVIERMQREAARGQRIVVRSDSQRREVEPLLRLAELEDVVMFVRCSDDEPRTLGGPTLHGSYAAISARLDRQGLSFTQRDVIEATSENAAFALAYAVTSRTEL